MGERVEGRRGGGCHSTKLRLEDAEGRLGRSFMN